MDTLRERLAELADDAPTSGAPAAELWARGKRAHRMRSMALASMVLIVVAAGARLGVSLPEDQPAVLLAPGSTAGISLPIEYPVGQELPDLGDTPGPLAAVWLAPREAYTLDDDDAGLAPRAVGLVAATGAFGTLPIELYSWIYEAPDSNFALSPDGRRIAYYAPPGEKEPAGEETSGELVVRDLVSGDMYSPAFDFEIRGGATWVDGTRLVGHVAGGTDGDGWVWDAREPGTAPALVNPYPYLEGPAGTDQPVQVFEGDPPWSCRSPTIRDDRTGKTEASVLCDDVGAIDSETLLGHVQSIAPHDPNDLNRAVVALKVRHRADFPFDEPALRRVVVTAGAPYPVAFATDLIAEALEAPPPAATAGISLPVEYPAGEELPALGDTPGPLAAIWVDLAGGAPQAVGLVAGSGMLGTLPIDLAGPTEATDARVALSPDGRRIAYQDSTGQLIIDDLVSGESYASTPEFEPRAGFTWIETTLIGRVAGGGERDGWVWEAGAAPKVIDPTTYELPNDAVWFAQGAVGPGTRDWWVAVAGGGPRSCSPPTLENHSERFDVPELCDVLGFMPGDILLGHRNPDHMSGGGNASNDGNGTVVALRPLQPDDESLVVVTTGAPERVAFAVDRIAEALETTGDVP